MKNRRDCSGLSLVELLAVTVVLALGLALLLPRLSVHEKSPRLQCVVNLKNVGLAFRIFATDHGDRFPADVLLTNGVPRTNMDALRVFLTLTNLIPTPNTLRCPSDQERAAASSFAKLAAKNLSYFASLSAEETMPQAFLSGDRNLQTNGVAVASGLLAVAPGISLSWSKQIHQAEGNIAMADGSVQQFPSTRLRQGLLDQAAALGTNYLAIP